MRTRKGTPWGVAEGRLGESGHLGSCYMTSGKSLLLPGLSFLLCQMKYDNACPTSSPLTLMQLQWDNVSGFPKHVGIIEDVWHDGQTSETVLRRASDPLRLEVQKPRGAGARVSLEVQRGFERCAEHLDSHSCSATH